MKTWAFLTALAFAAAPVPAQQPAPAAAPAAQQAQAAPMEDADPALWVVRDEDTTIYLFGTFHLLDGRPWFNDEVKTAFDASAELVLEAILPENPASLQPMVIRYAIDPEGRTLSSRLTAEENAAFNAAIAPLGAPAGAFDRFEPWFATLTLANVAAQRLGVQAANGPEQVLSIAARERGMPVGELEGFEYQFQLFDRLPEAQQLAQLRQTLESFDEIAGKLGPMLTAWSRGDVDGLVTLLNESEAEDPELHRIVFTDRNRNWAEWIQERMARPGTVFIAVGAGHLAGNDSVQAFLQQRGIASARVPNESASPAAN